ncbi:glycosyltransferase [Acaryochloris sp. IP29b_bin.137]|uniref:glycosyltransferase family protein n=1 Tax=Acaryochloris sp. IP29b_bin.137 TaxID=2969217 RepID=UPI00262C6B55|nr:glycosyltransferase [Acaryochloris sp. IP29b_bin.137]
MVYSHDAFGLGNLRRMLSICEYLLKNPSNLSILLVSGSPMLQAFRLPKGLDYIKLPCLNRGESGTLAAKYLGTELEETLRWRSHLIHSAALHFKPDVLLVDKKPYGIQQELTATLQYLDAHLPETKKVLLLRDILDSPVKTIREWKQLGYYEAIQSWYDQVLVVGMAELFDVAQEYQFPLPVAKQVRYCGYIRKSAHGLNRSELRWFLRIKPSEKVVLVTPGGGEDGYPLVKAYLAGLKHLPSQVKLRSVILCGPEMPLSQQQDIQKQALQCPGVDVQVFTDNLLGYLDAADAVVSMGGYNTLTEVLSLKKRTVVVPRITPSQEQLIRAERFMRKGLIRAIHPDHLQPKTLMQAVMAQLGDRVTPSLELDFNGLPNIADQLSNLLVYPPDREPALA